MEDAMKRGLLAVGMAALAGFGFGLGGMAGAGVGRALAQGDDSTINSSVLFDSSQFVTRQELQAQLDQLKTWTNGQISAQSGTKVTCITGTFSRYASAADRMTAAGRAGYTLTGTLVQLHPTPSDTPGYTVDDAVDIWCK
jgi:hypothetical protein